MRKQFVSGIWVAVLLIVNSNTFAETQVTTGDDNLPLTSDINAIWSNAGTTSNLIRQFAEKASKMTVTGRPLQLDESRFRSLLFAKTQFATTELANTQTINKTIAARLLESPLNENTILLPLPNGNELEFVITPSSVMSKALAKKFPEIKTWRVKGVSEDITGTIDFTSKGFHGMLLMPDGDRVFIQPDILSVDNGSSDIARTNFERLSSSSLSATLPVSSKRRYISFSQKQNKANVNNEFSCGVKDKPTLNFSPSLGHKTLSARLLARAAPDLITYRLAVAATGEYTQFHGGTKRDALSAIVTIISRVNEINSRDLGIKFELVDEQNDIIYLDPETDPYTNNNTDRLIDENNQNLSSAGVLSKTQYDIGHVFGAGGFSGLALVGSVCDNNFKASGATGIPQPFGDAFAIDFVAHEMGHQLGASHTFNSICSFGRQRIASTAVEPGSGSTIMSYAGICAPNNVQDSADPQFHIASINQIRSYTRSGDGSSCGVLSSSTNQNPSVVVSEDKVVPARTPLMLVAKGSDTDNDVLTYSWEQSDTGRASDINVDEGDNAIFRSQKLSVNGTRFIPSLGSLFSKIPIDGEYLPVSNRDINMVATVRDGKGGLIADLVKLEVVDTGESFRITSHNRDQVYGRGENVNIQWQRANTHLPPIACASIDIGVVTQQGDITLLANTANDGRHQFVIPSNAPILNNVRFIISCSDNAFFNVSNGHISIQQNATSNSIGLLREYSPNLFLSFAGENIPAPINSEKTGGGSMSLLLCLVFFILGLTRKRKHEYYCLKAMGIYYER